MLCEHCALVREGESICHPILYIREVGVPTQPCIYFEKKKRLEFPEYTEEHNDEL